MKSTAIQIALSLILGFVIGVSFDRLSMSNCSKKKCHCAGKQISKYKDCGLRGCKDKGPCEFGSFGHTEEIKEKMLERFNSKLALTDEQKTKVAGIFNSKHKRMLELRNEIKPKFEELKKSTDTEIKSILNPEQIKKFEEMQKRFEVRKERFEEN